MRVEYNLIQEKLVFFPLNLTLLQEPNQKINKKFSSGILSFNTFVVIVDKSKLFILLNRLFEGFIDIASLIHIASHVFALKYKQTWVLTSGYA